MEERYNRRSFESFLREEYLLEEIDKQAKEEVRKLAFKQFYGFQEFLTPDGRVVKYNKNTGLWEYKVDS